MTDTAKTEGLLLLRKDFSPDDIGKLPKPTRKQTDIVKNDFKAGIRCKVCGGWHHKDVVHLDYVGHAAITARLLDVDPEWNWEPLGVDERGLPALDNSGLLWIRLTVCGVTRIGCGDAGQKQGGDAMKERIGDALRNVAMRFGVGLSLWHKGGDLEAGSTFGIDVNDLIKEVELATTKEGLALAVKDAASLSGLDKSKLSAAYKKRTTFLRGGTVTVELIIDRLKAATSPQQHDEAMALAKPLSPEDMAKVRPIADAALKELF